MKKDVGRPANRQKDGGQAPMAGKVADPPNSASLNLYSFVHPHTIPSRFSRVNSDCTLPLAPESRFSFAAAVSQWGVLAPLVVHCLLSSDYCPLVFQPLPIPPSPIPPVPIFHRELLAPPDCSCGNNRRHRCRNAPFSARR